MKKLIIFLILLAAVRAEAQWVQVSSGLGNDTVIFALGANNMTLFAGTYYGGIYKSTNNGTSWTFSGAPDQFVHSLLASGINTYAGTEFGVYLSTNYGNSWVQINNGSIGLNVRGLIDFGNNIFKGTDGGVYMTSNNGVNWIYRSYGLVSQGIVTGFASIGGNLYACALGGAYLTTNSGNNWTTINNGITNLTANSIIVSGNNLFLGTYFGGVYFSSDYGVSWISRSSGLENKSVSCLAASGSNIFAGTLDKNGVLLTTNNGLNWLPVNQGLSGNSLTIYSLMVYDNYLYAGTEYRLWRRPLSQMIGIQSISEEIPSSYNMYQNYPNPFNPSTKIRFDVGKTENGKQKTVTKLIVFDITGREIATLVNEHLQPGSYEVTFECSKLTSGVYFYKLTTGEFSDTKRMILLK
ncbi:MAG: T9SS type A sorting domain-containing protein [Ignavibacteria bacterium]|nr:T9SS type A sorting domain-containing protein [Ignavibacteria bacterium]